MQTSSSCCTVSAKQEAGFGLQKIRHSGKWLVIMHYLSTFCSNLTGCNSNSGIAFLLFLSAEVQLEVSGFIQAILHGLDPNNPYAQYMYGNMLNLH